MAAVPAGGVSGASSGGAGSSVQSRDSVYGLSFLDPHTYRQSLLALVFLSFYFCFLSTFSSDALRIAACTAFFLVFASGRHSTKVAALIIFGARLLTHRCFCSNCLIVRCCSDCAVRQLSGVRCVVARVLERMNGM